jgi:hypothetical protein
MGEIARASQREAALEQIVDPQVLSYLEASLSGDPNAREDIVVHLRERLNSLVETELFPIRGKPIDELQVYTAWEGLARTTRAAAERLWRDDFLRDETNRISRQRLSDKGGTHDEQERAQAQIQHLELLCEQSHLLMLLWIESSFYRIRAMSNVRARGAVQGARRRADSVQGQLSKFIKEYARTLEGWGRELRGVTRLRLFGTQFGDAQRLKTLSKEFGPAKVRAEEAGWVALASDAETELRYQFFNVRLRERRRSGHYVSAVTDSINKATTGFGTKPRRFLITVCSTILAFASLFFLNDLFNPGIASPTHFCRGSNITGMQWYDIIFKYLYVAVTNLTALGSNSSVTGYCGGNSVEVLLVLGSLMGYFLLATLAALFFQQLTTSE